VAPIGSGMALYKWLTNKPGVAFSNRFALDPATPDRWSMMVFEHYRENIRPMLCVPLAAVTDLESERHGIANRANFTLDEAMLYATVKQMLLSLRLDPPPAAP